MIKFNNGNELSDMDNEALIQQFAEAVRLMDLASDEIKGRLLMGRLNEVQKSLIENNLHIIGISHDQLLRSWKDA